MWKAHTSEKVTGEMTMRIPLRFLAASLLTWIMAANTALAALLSGSINTTPSNTVDLTSLGATDWAYWGRTSAQFSGGLSRPPINTKDLGATPTVFSSITAVFPIATTESKNVRGGISVSGLTLGYTDGRNPPSTTFSSSDAGLIFPTKLDATDFGVQFNVTGVPSQAMQLLIWGTGTNGQGTLTATLNGVAMPLQLLSPTYDGTKSNTLYTINYTPDSISDVLNIQYVLTTDSAGTNSHVGLVAAALSPIPEPSSILAAGLGLGTCLIIVRRRKQ